jgi:hypothetical protein
MDSSYPYCGQRVTWLPLPRCQEKSDPRSRVAKIVFKQREPLPLNLSVSENLPSETVALKHSIPAYQA